MDRWDFDYPTRSVFVRRGEAYPLLRNLYRTDFVVGPIPRGDDSIVRITEGPLYGCKSIACVSTILPCEPTSLQAFPRYEIAVWADDYIIEHTRFSHFIDAADLHAEGVRRLFFGDNAYARAYRHTTGDGVLSALGERPNLWFRDWRGGAHWQQVKLPLYPDGMSGEVPSVTCFTPAWPVIAFWPDTAPDLDSSSPKSPPQRKKPGEFKRRIRF